MSALTSLYGVWYCLAMNEVQARLAGLRAKGWTIAAIASEVGLTVNAVEKWKAGSRQPGKPTIMVLDTLLNRKRIPKKRRYSKSQQGTGNAEQ